MTKSKRKNNKSIICLDQEEESDIITLGKQLKCLICKDNLSSNLHSLVKYEFKSSIKLRYKCLLPTSQGYTIEFTGSKESFKENKQKNKVCKDMQLKNNKEAIIDSKSAIGKDSKALYSKIPDIVIYIQKPKILSTSEYFTEQIVIEEKKKSIKDSKPKPADTYSQMPNFLNRKVSLDKIVNCPECGKEFSNIDKKSFADHVKNHAKNKYMINKSDSFEDVLLLKEINFKLNN